MKEERYVVVDTRSTCGNSVFFWCNDGAGYTVDLRFAAIYTQSEINNWKKAGMRSTDKPYPLRKMWKVAQTHVDIQDISGDEERPHSHTFYHLEVH